MKTSSAKSKGRRLCALVRESLLKNFDSLESEDIAVTPSGVQGPDLWMSPMAQRAIGFVFEMKNQEAINIWAALAQADRHAEATGLPGALVFARNRTQPRVAIKLEHFLNLIGRQTMDDQDEMATLRKMLQAKEERIAELEKSLALVRKCVDDFKAEVLMEKKDDDQTMPPM